MALATRCPHCQTAFRVASDQLKLRAGLVRCGTCKEIFNGIENLLHPDEDLATALAAPVPPIPTVVDMVATSKRPRGDDTRFNDLIAEVDHPETLRPSASADAGARADSGFGSVSDGGGILPQQPDAADAVPDAEPLKAGYGANYAPVPLQPAAADRAARRAPGPILRWPAAAVRVFPHAPGVDHDGASIAREAAGADVHGPLRDRIEPVLFDFTTNPAPQGADSQALWRALEETAPTPERTDVADVVDRADAADDVDGAEGTENAESTESADAASAVGADKTATPDADESNGAAAGRDPDMTVVLSADDTHGDEAHDFPRPPPGLLRAAANMEGAEATLLAPATSEPVTAATGSGDAPTVPAPAQTEPLPDFVVRDQERDARRRLRCLLLSAAAVALVLLAAAQAIYAGRTMLAANFVPLRPSLEAACRLLGCSVGLPMQIDAVSIEASDFQPVPGHTGQFMLTVLLRNRSATVQAWPTIELTLNDASEQAVGRRFIAPRDYLPSAQAALATTGFGAASEQQVKLYFDLSALKASGYKVYLFYP